MTNRKFLRSARAAVGATSTKGGGRTAKPGDHKRNRGRAASAGFEALRFEHCALPELDLDAIDLGTTLFGRPLAAPEMARNH